MSKDRVIDEADGTTLATDGEGSIPVAQELDFILHNDFRTRGAYDERLKTVAGVDYYGRGMWAVIATGLRFTTRGPIGAAS